MEIREIINLESGIYTAEMDGECVTILRDKGSGFSITHEPNSKGWCEVSYYDEDGECEGYGVTR